MGHYRNAMNRHPQTVPHRPPAVVPDAMGHPQNAMNRHPQTVGHRPPAAARDATYPQPHRQVSRLQVEAPGATHPQLPRHLSRAGHSAQASPARPLKTPRA